MGMLKSCAVHQYNYNVMCGKKKAKSACVLPARQQRLLYLSQRLKKRNRYTGLLHTPRRS